jgi:hypothetical protein
VKVWDSLVSGGRRRRGDLIAAAAMADGGVRARTRGGGEPFKLVGEHVWGCANSTSMQGDELRGGTWRARCTALRRRAAWRGGEGGGGGSGHSADAWRTSPSLLGPQMRDDGAGLGHVAD